LLVLTNRSQREQTVLVVRRALAPEDPDRKSCAPERPRIIRQLPQFFLIIAAVVTSDATQAVYQDKASGVERDIIHTTDKESRLGKVVNRHFVARKEKPPPCIGLILGSVFREHFPSVKLRIHGNRNQAQSLLPAQVALQRGHSGTHARTGSGTPGKDEIGNPNLPSQISETQVLPVAFNQGKIGQLGEHRQRSCSE
jgi:hypothetical protein